MRTIEVSDEIYEEFLRSASARGQSVEQYVADLARTDAPVFTPERLADIDRGVADIEAGRVSTWDETVNWIHSRRSESDAA